MLWQSWDLFGNVGFTNSRWSRVRSILSEDEWRGFGFEKDLLSHKGTQEREGQTLV